MSIAAKTGYAATVSEGFVVHNIYTSYISRFLMHSVDCHTNITMCWLFQELSVAASQSYSSLMLDSVQCHSAVAMPVDHSRFKRRIIIAFLLSSSSVRETYLCFQHGAMVLCPHVEWKRDRDWKVTAGCMISFCFMTTRYVIVIVHKSMLPIYNMGPVAWWCTLPHHHVLLCSQLVRGIPVLRIGYLLRLHQLWMVCVRYKTDHSV